MLWVELAPIFHRLIFVLVAIGSLSVVLRNSDGNENEIAAPRGIGVALVFLSVVLLIGFWPDVLSSDKAGYRGMFEYASAGIDWEFTNDWLFQQYVRFCAWLRLPSDLFFLLTATVFCSNFLIAGKRIFGGRYSLYFFALVVSLGFFAYGTNTMRAGLALSFFVLGLSFYPNKTKLVLLWLIAVGLHKSLVIPISAFFVAMMVPKPKFLFAGWFGCLGLSLLFGNQIQEMIGGYFAEAEDARVANYLLGESDIYRQGFRWDFIAYSLIPVVVGFWLRKKQFFDDRFFNLLLGTYIVANGFWLLVIRIPYSDRVAFLSWVLFPMVILYPLLKYPRAIPNARFLAVAAIFCMGAITIGLSLIRAGMR